MKKILLSQPMGGKSDEEILSERERMINVAKEKCGEVEVLDTFFQDFDGNALMFLAKSIEVLSTADAAVFAPGWNQKRGCRVEHQCCIDYGIPILIE